MYLISYDLSSDKLRNKIAKELENYGKRVQYSVFECRITKEQLKTLYQKLAKIMQEEENGSVRIYHICSSCEEKIRVIGIIDKKQELTDTEELIII